MKSKEPLLKAEAPWPSMCWDVSGPPKPRFNVDLSKYWWGSSIVSRSLIFLHLSIVIWLADAISFPTFQFWSLHPRLILTSRSWYLNSVNASSLENRRFLERVKVLGVNFPRRGVVVLRDMPRTCFESWTFWNEINKQRICFNELPIKTTHKYIITQSKDVKRRSSNKKNVIRCEVSWSFLGDWFLKMRNLHQEYQRFSFFQVVKLLTLTLLKTVSNPSQDSQHLPTTNLTNKYSIYTPWN